MARLELEVPEDLLAKLVAGRRGQAGPANADASEEILMLAAVQLFETGRLSSGAAARLVGMPRCVFLEKLGEYGGVTFDMTPEELEEDVVNARNAIRR